MNNAHASAPRMSCQSQLSRLQALEKVRESIEDTKADQLLPVIGGPYIIPTNGSSISH